MLKLQKIGFLINDRKKVFELFGSENPSVVDRFAFVSTYIPIQKSGAAKKHSRKPNT
jgi:hypothetical protein